MKKFRKTLAHLWADVQACLCLPSLSAAGDGPTCASTEWPPCSRQLHLNLHPLLSWTSLCNKGILCLVSVLSRVQPSLSLRQPRMRRKADCSELCIVRQDAAVSCRQMAPRKMVWELKVTRRSPIQLFVEPNLA